MEPSRLQTHAVARFSCLGAECPDTCCQGWGMQLTQETLDLYRREAPELVAAVTAGEAELVMRRDVATDACVKFDHGLCSIHRDYGDAFLGDACHFYPRITRALGTTLLTTAALSCPEAARQMLYTDDGLVNQPREAVRTPYSLKNYLPTELSEDGALAIHQAFLAMAGDEAASAGHNLLRVSAVARAIEMQPVRAWQEALPLYISMADGRIPTAEPAAADLFNLFHAFYGLAHAAPRLSRRLQIILDAIADQLGASCDAGGALQLTPDAAQRGVQVLTHMRAQAEHLQPVLRRYLQAQLSQGLFPFAGLGTTLGERITIIGVRFATLRLALATLPLAPSSEAVVEVVYGLSRFMDHLADPSWSLSIYKETGWVREARLRALVGE